MAVEKYFGLEANYAKGKGSMFKDYMLRYHPTSHLFPLVRACGGNRQDMATEGALPLLANIPFYLEFLIWRMRCGAGEGILEKNLYTELRSVEMVSLLRVLSILHVAIVLPMRWLAGRCCDLAEYGFGVADMGEVIDLMDGVFAEVVEDGSMLLDDGYAMSIFQPLLDKLPPFKAYMDYMFEEKQSRAIGTREDDHKILLFDVWRAELFFPTRGDMRETNLLSAQIASEAASIFQAEFRDTSKATSAYLSAIQGRKSMGKVSDKERLISVGLDATNSISESLHASTTHGLKMYGTIRMDHSAAEGQSRSNNDFGRGTEIGYFHTKPYELQRTAIIASKEKAASNRRSFDVAVARQFQLRREGEELALKKAKSDATEDHIVAIYMYDQFHSKRCWKTVRQANHFYSRLKSEAAKLRAVKEQILIRYLGLGWVDAHHPWSAGTIAYTSKQLLRHLTLKVIPMADDLPVPTEPPLNLPSLPVMSKLGTVSSLAKEHEQHSEELKQSVRQDALKEKEDRESRGFGDRWKEEQQIVPPDCDDSLRGFNIEMAFSYMDDEGDKCWGWYNGVVKKVVNERSHSVLIEWDENCLGARDQRVTKQQIKPNKWNPDSISKGGWREYLTS